MSIALDPQFAEVFPNTGTHVASVSNTAGRPIYFLIAPTKPGANGIVVFRGKQSEQHYSALLPKLPHAVSVESDEPVMLCLNWEGDLEVCRAMESGSVVVVAGRGEVATEEAAAEHSKLSGTKVTPHPYFCLPPLQLTAGLLSGGMTNGD